MILQRVIYILLFVVKLSYFPVAQRTLALVHCEPAGTKQYLMSAPYIDCSDDRYQTIRVLAIVDLAIFVILFPIGVFSYLLYHRNVMENAALGDQQNLRTQFYQILDRLYWNEYRDDMYLYSIFYFLVQFVLALMFDAAFILELGCSCERVL